MSNDCEISDRGNDDDDSRDWNAFAAEEFFKGYAEGDAIYDELTRDEPQVGSSGNTKE
jgi:hypothetical protein